MSKDICENCKGGPGFVIFECEECGDEVCSNCVDEHIEQECDQA